MKTTFARRTELCQIWQYSIHLTDIIIRSKFGINWYSSFSPGEKPSLPPPIETKTRPYHMHVCAGDTNDPVLLGK